MDLQHVDSHLFVVFGATGDLMRRKLLPALYHLYTQNRLMERFKILGVARDTDLDDGGFRAWAREALEAAGLGAEEGLQRWCDQRLHYQPVGKGDVSFFTALKTRIERLERTYHLPGNRTFYLALPPSAFPSTIEGLGAAGLNEAPGWTRLVIEKPFGRDLVSARALNKRYAEAFGPLPDGYETLLFDILTGDQTLFVRADEVEAAWHLYAPLFEEMIPVHLYEAGGWGPQEADHLFAA